MRRVLSVLAVLLLLVGVAIVVLGRGWLGTLDVGGEPTPTPRAAASVAARSADQAAAARSLGRDEPKQILFGDLHVHTTFSLDAFMLSLPVTQGEGARPPADACDFARFCSQLDFWSINDHAEALTPRQWSETIETVRQCNAVAGDSASPDTVAFLGWEWSQVGRTPEDHWGHKNVVLRGLADSDVPARPIASGGQAASALRAPNTLERAVVAAVGGSERFQDLARFLTEVAETPACEDGVPSPDLPTDCIETAPEPSGLFRKLDEWGVEALVIPHGTTWGFYTPPGSSWDKQLTPEQHDPARQTLIEVFSGHGNSEEYRDFRAVEFGEDGTPSCPEPRSDYLPSCWRAGEIIRARCLDSGAAEDECDERAAETRRRAAASGVAGHVVVPGETPDDWLDAGQCRDCVLPAFNYRPLSSVQYMLTLRRLGGLGRFRFGFLGSSDNHFARPGTGYKEVRRRGMTESRDNLQTGLSFLRPPATQPEPFPVDFDPSDTSLRGFQLLELERQASFFMTGGLVAAHAAGRDRDAIWNALARKEVYGTSGPRILLWFDLLNPSGAEGSAPMGSSVVQRENPRFEVRAAGSFEQKPGCPADSAAALGDERVASLCLGECYHPSDQRRPITRIEVVRIRPRTSPDESVASLIDDPWKTILCSDGLAGCSARFEDPDFATLGRDTLYYVRAIEAPSLAVNAGNLRCERDADGACVRPNRCGTPATVGDDCLGETEERAWSSPIYVDWAPEDRDAS
ncbi:MAG: DUF3604 domain-containing protein [Myxococcota bacterium]